MFFLFVFSVVIEFIIIIVLIKLDVVKLKIVSNIGNKILISK